MPDDDSAILGEERLQRALELGYAYLNRRERTVEELRGQLERKGIAPPLAESAVAVIAEQGLVDDERFARLFVADKRTLEQWGNDRIMRGLLSRGIERGLAQTALAEADVDSDSGEAESELDRALTVLRRRFPAPPADRRERERALGMLMRKGYESEIALDALSAYARHD